MRYFPRSGFEEVPGDGYLKHIILRENELGIEGTLLQEVQFTAGDKVPFHFHRSTKEVFFCLRGPAPFVINGQGVDMKEGDCLICEPGDVHGNPVIGNDFRILVLKIGLKDHDTVWFDRDPHRNDHARNME